MPGPRDKWVDPDPHQQSRLDQLTAAGEALYDAMHVAEGSNPPGEHQEHEFRSRRMIRAAEQIEVALMLARKAAVRG